MIYLIRSETSGLIKIGSAVDVTKRLAFLQTGSADPLHLFRVLEGSRVDEVALHRRFAEYRRRGEWFALPDEVASGPLGLVDVLVPERVKRTNGGAGGRPPIGERTMTKAERDKRHRTGKAAQLAAMQAALEQIVDGNPDWREIARKALPR